MTHSSSENYRTFQEFIKLTSIVAAVELTIFFLSLAFYHYCIFRKKLSKEIERIRIEGQKLERITKGEPEPELLSPTQKSSLLEAEPTQLSEKEKPKKKKIQTKKAKTAERKKETKKKTIRKTSSNNLRLSLEDTQRDDYDPEVTDAPAVPPFNPLQTPPNEDSHYDNASLRRETSIREAKSDTDQTRTCSSLNEKSVYSPKTNATQDKSLEKLDDPDMRTAREDLWN